LFGQTFRDRVAVTFITLSVVVGSILGIATVRSYTQPQSTLQAATGPSQGSVAGATSGGSGAPAGGGAAATSGGGGGGAPGGAGGGGASANQAASGVSRDKIVVGGIFDMTGPVDSSVERDTVKSYFQKVNAAGGINGRQLQMIDCDSKYDSTAAHQCAIQMVNAHVLAIVGWTAPQGENNEVKFLASDNGIPIIGGLGTPEEFAYPLSYPVSTPFTRYGQAIGARAGQLGFKHPAVVTLSDVPWVVPVRQKLIDALTAAGAPPTHIEDAKGTDGDYTAHVYNLMHANDAKGTTAQCNGVQTCPDSLVAALDPFSYTRLFQAMDRAQWHTHLLASGLDKGSVQGAYGDQLVGAQSLVPFLSPYDNPGNPTVADYLSSVKRYYPNQYAALDIYTQHSWTAAMVFAEALKRAGPGVTRDSLAQSLNSIQGFQTGWSTPLSYGSGTHDPNHCFRFMTHDASTWRTISDWVCLN
jgi:ABC-type branched-subunit amino acid transport system substrate-binding protein